MNLLITGAWQQATDYLPQIEKRHDVKFLQYESNELPTAPEWVEGIIGNGIFLSHPIETFTNLRYIQLTSVGFDRVPMEYIQNSRITINNARGVFSVPMAEYALSGVLSLYKRQRFFFENQMAHKWEKNRNLQELCGKSVCIIGCGSIGSECAKRFEAMGCSVIGIDPMVKEHKNFLAIWHPKYMIGVLSKTDVLIITLPLNEHTRHIIGVDELKSLKDGAVIVNISRGALIEPVALTSELMSGRISAVLDVFEEEPLSEDNELWDLDNVIITPHNSFVGEGNGKRLSDLIMENLHKYEEMKK